MSAGLMVLAAAAAQAQAQAQTAPAAPSPLAGFGWFAELAGSCWKGDHPDGKTSDTQCYKAQHGRLIRGTIHVGRDNAPVFEGESVYAVDPVGGKHVVYTQWGAGGVYATGTLTFEGDTLVFRGRLPDGNEAPVRYVWRREGADAFRVSRQRSGDEGWKEILAVDYRRLR